MYWDVHCHLSDLRWEQGVAEVIAEARARGINGFGMGGYDPDDWQRQLQLVERFPQTQIVPVFGLHPMWVSQNSEENLEVSLDLLSRQISKAKAVGEIGLDARKDYVKGWSLQMEAFRAQLEMAWLVKKPVVLHIVWSHSEALQLLLLHKEQLCGGFVHAFSGEIDTAKQYLDLNLSLSIGGAVTHDRSVSLREVVRWLPPDELLLETDSPDQKIKDWPSSSLHRPVALWNIAQIVAELRGETPEKVLQQSSENFCRILRL